jgi:tetratricopeptide (TPR) repeat protein
MATAVFDGHLCVAEYLLYGPTPYEQVIELGERLRDSARRSGAIRAVAFAAALIGEAALLSGDLERADRELAEAVDLHHGIAATAGEAHSLQRLAEVRVHQGRREEARQLLRRAFPLARWSPLALHLVQRIYGTTIAAADTPEEAYAAAERADAVNGPQDACTFCQVLVEVPAAIACADVGDLAGAARHLAGAETSTRLWPGTSLQAGVLEARAHLARAVHDEPAAAALLTEAADRFQAAGQPLDAARCRAKALAPATVGDH